jgi:TRAP-type C4-dicarboxylate transport system permease small subunit
VPSWLDRLERLLTAVAAGAIIVMMLLTTADAAGRYLFNRPIVVAFEVTTNFLMVAAVFLAMPFAYRQGANIRVTFLVQRLRGGARLLADHVVQVVSLLYCAALVYATLQQTRHVWATGTTFVTIELPLWPAHLLVCLGLAVTTLLLLFDLPRVRRGRSSLFLDDQ